MPSALDNRPLKFNEFKKRIGPVICTSATPGDWEEKSSDQIVEQIIRPTYLVDPKIEIKPVYSEKTDTSQIDDLKEEIKKENRVLVNSLTKKMSEELASYLDDEGIKSKYLHSDIGTMERASILTEFREGKFDVLVGINLLREGLDLPEVSLVAILEADQEGFLRSETAFIQTMGRAARNKTGRVILYADKMTGSMKRAIDEVERRRQIQLKFNKKHNKEPKTIEKEVAPLINLAEIVEDETKSDRSRKKNKNSKKRDN